MELRREPRSECAKARSPGRHDVVAERLYRGAREGEEALEIRKDANIHIRHIDLMINKNAARGDRTALARFGWSFRFCRSYRNRSVEVELSCLP